MLKWCSVKLSVSHRKPWWTECNGMIKLRHRKLERQIKEFSFLQNYPLKRRHQQNCHPAWAKPVPVRNSFRWVHSNPSYFHPSIYKHCRCLGSLFKCLATKSKHLHMGPDLSEKMTTLYGLKFSKGLTSWRLSLGMQFPQEGPLECHIYGLKHR